MMESLNLVLQKVAHPKLIGFVSALPVILFASLMFQMTKLHNSSLQATTASVVDSGSLMTAYLEMTSPPYNFDQQKHFHTSFYGGLYNVLASVVVLATRFILEKSNEFSLYTAAVQNVRLISLAFTLGSLYVLAYKIPQLYGRNFRNAILPTLLLLTFPPLVKLSYEIHPEPLGLFFASLCLYNLKKYLIGDSDKVRRLIKILSFGLVAFLAKQSFLIYLIPILFLIDKKLNIKNQRDLVARTLFWMFFAVAISNVHILLNPIEYLKVLLKNIKFLQPGMSGYTDSIQAYFHLLTNSTQIVFFFTIYFTISIFYLIRTGPPKVTARFRFILFVMLITYLIQLIFFLRYNFVQTYLYPLLPIVIFMYYEIKWRRIFKIEDNKIFKCLILGVIWISIIFNAFNSAGIISRDFILDNTVQFKSAKIIESFRMVEKYSIIYDASLPINEAKFQRAANNFQFSGDAETQIATIVDWAPDIIVLDNDCGWCDNANYREAAKKLGLIERHEISGTSGNSLSCNLYSGYVSGSCLVQTATLMQSQDSSSYEFRLGTVEYYLKPVTDQKAQK